VVDRTESDAETLTILKPGSRTVVASSSMIMMGKPSEYEGFRHHDHESRIGLSRMNGESGHSIRANVTLVRNRCAGEQA